MSLALASLSQVDQWVLEAVESAGAQGLKPDEIEKRTAAQAAKKNQRVRPATVLHSVWRLVGSGKVKLTAKRSVIATGAAE
jgi:hypothetical protein